MARDLYEVLGLGRSASADEIQQAYRRLARKYHPDVNKDPEAEDRFKDVNEAYTVLSDPATRKRYDRFGEDFRSIPEDYDERVAAAGRARGAQPGGNGRVRVVRGFGEDFAGGFGDDFGGGFGAGTGFEDLFGGMFGAGAGGRAHVPGADQEAELPLTVEEAYRGGTRGVTDGQRIRLAGQGGRGNGDAPPGDLYLRVRIKPHPRFRLDGRDIHVQLPLSPWEAALGAILPVHTPSGTAKVNVPAGSSSGRRLRLRGEGMPDPRGGAGDLYAELRVTVPPRLTDRERELFEQLASASDFDPRAAT
jgi:curved DNA-binding protein